MFPTPTEMTNAPTVSIISPAPSAPILATISPTIFNGTLPTTLSPTIKIPHSLPSAASAGAGAAGGAAGGAAVAAGVMSQQKEKFKATFVDEDGNPLDEEVPLAAEEEA